MLTCHFLFFLFFVKKISQEDWLVIVVTVIAIDKVATDISHLFIRRVVSTVGKNKEVHELNSRTVRTKLQAAVQRAVPLLRHYLRSNFSPFLSFSSSSVPSGWQTARNRSFCLAAISPDRSLEGAASLVSSLFLPSFLPLLADGGMRYKVRCVTFCLLY